MSEILIGHLIYTKIFGWQVRYTFGENQCKSIPIHHSCRNEVSENGIEGEEVNFMLKGTFAPSTLNGVVTSALIIY